MNYRIYLGDLTQPVLGQTAQTWPSAGVMTTTGILDVMTAPGMECSVPEGVPAAQLNDVLPATISRGFLWNESAASSPREAGSANRLLKDSSASMKRAPTLASPPVARGCQQRPRKHIQWTPDTCAVARSASR